MQLRSRQPSKQTVEQVWAQALERKDTEKLVTGILEQIVNDAVDIAQMKTVVRTPRVPVAPVQEPGDVFQQMDTPVRDWCMEPMVQAQAMNVEAQVHSRPVTPDMRPLVVRTVGLEHLEVHHPDPEWEEPLLPFLVEPPGSPYQPGPW